MAHAAAYCIAAFFNGFFSFIGYAFSGFFGFVGYTFCSFFGLSQLRLVSSFAPDQVLEQADRMRAAAANANSFFILDSFKLSMIKKVFRRFAQ